MTTLRAKPIGPVTSPGLLVHERDCHASSSTAPVGRSVDVGPEGVEDEIIYYGSTVIWSRGAEVYRRWTYETQQGDGVSWAGFVCFSSSSSPDHTVTLDVGDDTFGPFHSSRHASWSEPPARSSSSSATLTRTVMICLSSRAIVYYPSGESHTVHVPFVIGKAFPLSSGVLLQRRMDREPNLFEDTDNIPLLFTLSDPFEELKEVVQGIGPAEEHIDTAWDTLLVSHDPYPFVIMYDPHANEVIFHIQHIIPLVTCTPHLRPHELLALPLNAPAARPSLHRTGSAFTPGERRISTLNAEAMDRTRRGPRISRGGQVESQLGSTGELQAALDPPTLPSAPTGSKQGKGRMSVVSDRRESSFLRPALSGAAEKDLRETTMLMGLEREQQKPRSEVVLERIWSWKLSERAESISAFISDQLPDSLHINLHFSSTLYVFAVCRATRWNISDPLTMPCEAAIPIISTRHQIHDTVVLADKLHLITSANRIIPIDLSTMSEALSQHLATTLNMAERHSRQITGITDPIASRFTVRFADGDCTQVSVDYRLQDRLVRQCFEAISTLLPPQDVFDMKRQLVGADWPSFHNTIRARVGLECHPPPRRDSIARRLASKVESAIPKRNAPATTSKAAVPILLALHLVAQDCRLSQSKRSDLDLVASLVQELAAAVGRRDWLDYWLRLVPQDMIEMSRPGCDTSMLDTYISPPDIVAHLARRLHTPLKTFPTLQTINPHISEFGRTIPCQATLLITSLYDCLGVSPDDLSPLASLRKRVDQTVRFMTDRKLDMAYIHDLPSGIAMPILEILRIAQVDPSKSWTVDMFHLVNRSDLAAQAGSPVANRDKVKSVQTHTLAKSQPQINMPHVRFGSDRRLAEVERVMQTIQTRTILAKEKNANDSDMAAYQQSMVNTIAIRTLSILVGQAIFNYATRRAALTDTFDIPLIELTVKVVPGNQTLPAQISPDHADWPCFHNGVATAMSISPDSKGIDSSWIVLNRPSTLNPEHGGFLLGLGLTGQLRRLATHHAFPYLEPRHDFTSVGLLLGLAASFAGSGDLLLTKILSLHTHALLPLGSMELNASTIVQCASLVGLGLLHVGSRTLRIAEVALSEVGRKQMPGVDNFADFAEAYSFSASMAFGLIMLARGGTSEVDRRIVAKLSTCILGGLNEPIDTTVTAPGATLALGLMYLKSNRSDIADMLDIPSSAFALEHVRPESLLLRVFARALIMWDDIAPSMGWIENQIPSFIHHQNHKKTSHMELHAELAYMNIVAGACFAIGLKYAGTAGEVAHNSLMQIYGVLSKAAGVQSISYEGSIRRSAARQALNVVTLALTAVMSGTGELGILRRLRISHSQEGAGVNYGTHMATHMALGLLFLGRGYHTLGNSNLAIAALAISFFPRFGATSGDNRAYPQALRHLWALAAEPRCLVARDVDTGETVYLPVKIKSDEAGQERTQSLISPTLVAPFDTLRSIEIDSPRYWPITYDMSNTRDRDALVQTRTIYVKRKAGYLDYDSDPRGNRSMFIRTGAMTGLDLNYDLVSPAAPAMVQIEEVLELMMAHSGDAEHISLARRFGGNALLDQAVRIVLLECVSLDKQRMIPIYLSLLASCINVETIHQLAFLKAFYSTLFDRHYALPSARQTPWIRGSFISALLRRSAGSVSADYWRTGKWVNAEQLAVHLARHNVPALPLLEWMRDKDGANVLQMRDAVTAYLRVVGEQSDLIDTPINVPSWRSDSMESAMAAWKT